MPNRILREGILTSPRMAKLGWPEEVFYRRLMSVVDDFGRYYADTGLLLAACYPRQLKKVSDSDIGKWLSACETAALVRVYPAKDGERYLQLLDFGQQVRAKKSKYPDPPSECAASATQTQSNGEASAHLDVFVSGDVSVSEDVGEKPRKRDPAPGVARPDDVPESVWRDWTALRAKKRTTVSETAIEGARDEAAKAGISLEAFLRIWVTRGSQGMEAAWIKPEEKRAAQSFAERDREHQMQRWEEMTGRTHPDRQQQSAGVVIDMPTPHQLTIGGRS